MPPKAASEILQIKVTLLGIRPPIWRRLLLSADATLAQLHRAIQAAMGWYDCHLHEFRIDDEPYGPPDPESRPMGDERKTRLSQALGCKGARGDYTYDFGDSWEHSLLVEKVLPPDPDVRYPVCVAGKRACPPEDCGGIPGYYDLLQALRDPSHPERQELLEWAGDWDPEAFSLEQANLLLADARRR